VCLPEIPVDIKCGDVEEQLAVPKSHEAIGEEDPTKEKERVRRQRGVKYEHHADVLIKLQAEGKASVIRVPAFKKFHIIRHICIKILLQDLPFRRLSQFIFLLITTQILGAKLIFLCMSCSFCDIFSAFGTRSITYGNYF